MIGKIVLIGAVATGKTAIGESIAKELGMFFATTEELIEYENTSMAEIKKHFGQEGVEKYKNRSIAGMQDLTNTVLVAYDDCLETEEQRNILKSGAVVIHLYASSESIATRLKRQGKKGKYSIYEIEEIQRKLLPIYNKMADIKISINRKKPEAIQKQIIESLIKFVENIQPE